MSKDESLTQSSTPRMLDQPWVPVALPLLPDEVAYKIHRLDQISPLRVEVQTLWPGADILDPGEITKVTWLWDGVAVDSKWLEAPYSAIDLPNVAGEIPSILLDVPGLHTLQYVVELVPGNVADPSFPIQIDVDKVAPNQGQVGNRLVFDDYILNNGVTDEYLDDPVNNDKVVAVVPRWPDMRLADRVDGYLTLLPSVRPAHARSRLVDVVASVEITQAHLDGAPVELVFAGDVFRSLVRNREFSAQYRLNDRAGWEGPASRTVVVLNALSPSPTNFPAPEVPQAFGAGANGRIDLEDAREPGGVYMTILEISGSAEGDIVRPLWNLIPLPQIIIGAFQVWPIHVPIPWPTLAQGGFELVRGTIRASYTWQRGGGTTRPSLPRFVPVDLTAAGELNPDNPDFFNRLLPLPTVKGLTGDDVLTVADRDRPADVLLLQGKDFNVGDELQLYWNGVPVPGARHFISTGDAEGDPIPLQIPWYLIELTKDGLVNMCVETFNGVNRQRSENKVVRVALTPIVGLRRSQYPDVDYAPGPGSGFIGCQMQPHPSNGVRVLVPGDDTRLEVGDVLRLRWVGYASPNGNQSHEISGSIWESDSPALTSQEVQNGYQFTVPFNPPILLPGLVKPEDYAHTPTHGSAATLYTVIRGGVSVGSSPRSLVLVTLIRPGGAGPCISAE